MSGRVDRGRLPVSQPGRTVRSPCPSGSRSVPGPTERPGSTHVCDCKVRVEPSLQSTGPVLGRGDTRTPSSRSVVVTPLSHSDPERPV